MSDSYAQLVCSKCPIYMDMLQEGKPSWKVWKKRKHDYEVKHVKAIELFHEGRVLRQAEEEFKDGRIFS